MGFNDSHSTCALLHALEDDLTRNDFIDHTTASLVRTLNLTPSQAEYARTCCEMAYARGHSDAMHSAQADTERMLTGLKYRVQAIVPTEPTCECGNALPPQGDPYCYDCQRERATMAAEALFDDLDDRYSANVDARQEGAGA